MYTVNSEIFARVLFSRNFAYAKFRENKILAKGEITLSTTDIGASYHSIVAKFSGRKFVF